MSEVIRQETPRKIKEEKAEKDNENTRPQKSQLLRFCLPTSFLSRRKGRKNKHIFDKVCEDKAISTKTTDKENCFGRRGERLTSDNERLFHPTKPSILTKRRRFAICEEIEREMFFNSELSLRKQRKDLIIKRELRLYGLL